VQAEGEASVDLYATKGAINGRLVPLVDRLARAGVSPDQVTLAAVPVAVVGGGCLLLSPAAPVLLLAVPLLVGLRLVLNLIDGNMARRTGRTHARGELYNELGDRLGDTALLAPVAFLPGAQPQVVLLGVLGGVLASYTGLTAKAAGGDRIYRGVLSKPGRMALLSACSVWAFVAPVAGGSGDVAWAVFGPVLLAGTILTLAERIVIAVRQLD
jgi:CDP-diacylglycerol--glycerol-3-phosphate 3-phosphatidyltransferase